MHVSEGKEGKEDSDLLWGCFVNWVETLEKVDEKKG